VAWYGLDLDQLFAAMHARGAALVGLNHPLKYLERIGYDPLTGTALLADPTRLQYPADAKLWSWNLDMFETMNGTRAIFRPAGKTSLALFDAWMSFHNLGHRVAAVGVSDAHDWDLPGTPRTWYASPTDDPAAFVEADLVAAVKGGRLLASAGAFARVTVDGTAGLGDLVTDTDGVVDLAVRIEAIPEIDVAWFKVFVNCDLVQTVAASAPDQVVKYDGTLQVPIAADAHVVVAGFGTKAMPRGLAHVSPTGAPRFLTNPVYVDADGNGQFDPPGGKTCTYDLDPPAS
jgi:hypothetical protein